VNPKCFEKATDGVKKEKVEKEVKKSESEKMETASESGQEEAPSSQPENEYCSMWFIGLEFERSANLNVDLTVSIQSFTDSVHKHAVSCF
jgi:poly(A) polymerase Pap1